MFSLSRELLYIFYTTYPLTLQALNIRVRRDYVYYIATDINFLAMVLFDFRKTLTQLGYYSRLCCFQFGSRVCVCSRKDTRNYRYSFF